MATATAPASGYKVSGKKSIIEKDPQAVLDYRMNWTEYLTDPVDTIASVEYVLTDPPDSSLTIVSDEAASPYTTVWLSGGTLGTTYTVTARITTASTPTARVDDRSFYVKIVQK